MFTLLQRSFTKTWGI
ncbi:UNVERIFIED_CONTAM: hypothetical protein GTU68_058748 [Idotea baltica]|nr:hypothetical protein [Idotea baltica]